MLDRFIKLFTGLDRAYGTYKIDQEQTPEQKKLGGRAQTVKLPLERGHYKAHIEGISSLGVIPICDGGDVHFAALDIDRYDIQLDKLAAYLAIKKKYPAVVCRSKSGGAHIYLFFKKPQSMRALRPLLKELATHLGFPGCEIFPKQDNISKSDIGNWINLPYYDAAHTTRYALGADGVGLSLAEFLAFADERLTDIKTLRGFELEDSRFKTAPPCIKALTAQGKFPEGSMNNGLFNLGVFARKRWPQDWQTLLGDWNQEFMRPGKPVEVKAVIASLQKRDYEYMCAQAPVVDVCDKTACRLCKYGPLTGGGSSTSRTSPEVELVVDSVTVIQSDPPVWCFTITGDAGMTELRLETDELMEQRKFHKRCLERLLFMPSPVKADVWRDWVNAQVAVALRIEAPTDASPEGLFWGFFERFLLDRPRARSKDEILGGKPWVDSVNRIYFRAQDLYKYLQQQRFTAFKEHQVFGLLKQAGGVDRHFYSLKGRGTNCWSVPLPEEQNEDHDVPRVEKEGDF